MREEIDREAELRREIEQITAVTAAFESAAGDLPKAEIVTRPSIARAREEVIELLGVNYVGPEMLGRLLYGDENKFLRVELDYVKLKEILIGPDEFEPLKRRFETYALVFKPPISFVELRDRANEAARYMGKAPAFYGQQWYETDAFATEVSDSGSWELVRRATVPGSTSKVFEKQKELIIGKANLVPASFLALASLSVGQFLAYDMKLYDGKWHYGRTSTGADSGDRVYLSTSHTDGVYLYDDDAADDDIGLAAAWNLEVDHQNILENSGS